MGTTSKPGIRKLAAEECEAILSRNHVGRLAYARKNHIDITPVHYVYADGWIYGRTSAGAKRDLLGPRWWPVAFEVDEVENLFRWRSVVVRGGFYSLDPRLSAADEEVWRKAVEVLRTLVPETLGENDPVPERTVVFRIALQDVSGREAVPEVSAAAPAAI
jgi:uncharacterized protein